MSPEPASGQSESTAASAARPWAPAGSAFWYRLIRFVVRCHLTLYNRFRAEGGGTLAPELEAGGLLIVANHASFLDIPIVANCFSRHVSFVARNTLADSRFIAWVIEVCGGILIRPGESDRAALRAISERLDAGYAVAIFPEGTRSRDGQLGEFRGGALFSAKRSRVPMLPVGIRGSFASFSRRHRFPRPASITARVGTSVSAQEADAPERLREAIRALMGAPERTPSSTGASVTS